MPRPVTYLGEPREVCEHGKIFITNRLSCFFFCTSFNTLLLPSFKGVYTQILFPSQEDSQPIQLPRYQPHQLIPPWYISNDRNPKNPHPHRPLSPQIPSPHVHTYTRTYLPTYLPTQYPPHTNSRTSLPIHRPHHPHIPFPEMNILCTGYIRTSFMPGPLKDRLASASASLRYRFGSVPLSTKPHGRIQ